MFENGDLPHLKTVINFDSYDESIKDRLSSIQRVNFITYSEIHNLGSKSLANWIQSHQSPADTRSL